MKRWSTIAAVCALLSGCDTGSVEPTPSLSSYSTATLWQLQGYSSSPTQLAMAEAELGARGETTSGSQYLGQRTASAYGVSRYSRGGKVVSDAGRDCSDFASSADAQRFFLANGGPTYDPYNLDGDGDGLACEWGAALKRNVSYHAQTYRVPVYSGGSSYCHVGPRGGTYTITASGNKNYGGC